MPEQTLRSRIEEMDFHYQDCETSMGKIRHEKYHGELCSCVTECDCSAMKDALALFAQAEAATMAALHDDSIKCDCGDECMSGGCYAIMKAEVRNAARTALIEAWGKFRLG